MAGVRIPQRVFEQIERLVGEGRPETAGGLLIGYRTEAGYWVERILACPNSANGDADVRYVVSGPVLANVRRTLGAGPLAVVGSFFGGGRASPDSGHGGRVTDGAEIVCHLAAGSLARAWAVGQGGEREEVAVEIVPTRTLPPTICPD